MLLDHKIQKGAFFLILSGDTNELNSGFVQIVSEPTGLNPPAILDLIITNLANLYQDHLMQTKIQEVRSQTIEYQLIGQLT